MCHNNIWLKQSVRYDSNEVRYQVPHDHTTKIQIFNWRPLDVQDPRELMNKLSK